MITVTIASLLLAQGSNASAKDVFLQTMAHYGKLDSFSADLDQDNSSGAFSGKYQQHLDFKKGKGFRLVVTGLKGSRPDNVAPDYYCDGKEVTIKGRNYQVDPINKDKNIAAGYEVSGGVVMTWLLNSPIKAMFTRPPEGLGPQFNWGKRTKWKGTKVEEILMTRKIGNRSTSAVFLIAPDHKHVVGFEWTRDGKTGILQYKNQKDNPKIDTKRFVPPAR